MAVNGAEIYAGSELIVGGGVFRSVDNGLNWAPMNNNLPPLQIKALAYRPGDRLFAEVRDNGLYANNLTTDIKNTLQSPVALCGAFILDRSFSLFE